MREKIIDTAINEFTKSGLKFTMNDIAKSMGISKKTIYTVFESKQAVLMGIADRYSDDFLKMQEEIEADESLDVVGKVEQLLCALPTKYHNIGLSGMYELAEKYPQPYKRLMESVNRGWELVADYLKRGIEEDKIAQVPLPIVMAMVEGTVRKFMDSRILVDNGLTYEEGKMEMVKVIMYGIRKQV